MHMKTRVPPIWICTLTHKLYHPHVFTVLTSLKKQLHAVLWRTAMKTCRHRHAAECVCAWVAVSLMLTKQWAVWTQNRCRVTKPAHNAQIYRTMTNSHRSATRTNTLQQQHFPEAPSCTQVDNKLNNSQNGFEIMLKIIHEIQTIMTELFLLRSDDSSVGWFVNYTWDTGSLCF